jgi:hypothetical protein
MTAVVALIDVNFTASSAIKLTTSITVGVVTYFGGLVLLKEFSSEEVAAGRKIFSKAIRRYNSNE